MATMRGELDSIAGITNDPYTSAAILTTLYIPGALLSIFGSGMILHQMFGGQENDSNIRHEGTYNRILASMSILDILASANYTLYYVLLPSNATNGWTIGNDATCSLSGFILQLAVLGSVLFYFMLNCYFLLTVRFNISRENMTRVFEPCVYAIALGWPLATAIAALALDMYSSFPDGQCVPLAASECAVESGKNADSSTSVRCKALVMHYIMTTIPALTAFILILGINIIIYFHVRKIFRRAQAHTFAAVAATTVASRTRNEPDRGPEVADSEKGVCDKTCWGCLCGLCRKSGSEVIPAADPHTLKIQSVAAQCFLYVFVLLHTVSASSILFVFGSYLPEWLFSWISVYKSLSLPMNGFLNFLVYTRPQYMHIRQIFPDQTRWWAFRRAHFGESVQPFLRAADGNRQRTVESTRCTEVSNTHQEGEDADSNTCHHDHEDEGKVGLNNTMIE